LSGDVLVPWSRTGKAELVLPRQLVRDREFQAWIEAIPDRDRAREASAR
jgi:hypothetical protein